MSWIVTLITGKLLPYLIGFGGLIVAFFGYGWKKRREGIKAQKAKQAAASAKARKKRDEIESDVGSLTDEQKRKELGKWAE
jgi:hypothetical protein